MNKITINQDGIESITFTTELVREDSYTVSDVGNHESTMALYRDTDGVPSMIEWDIPNLDETEHIGLWFEGNKLVDYDGLMGDMPIQAIEMLEQLGYVMTYARPELEDCWTCDTLIKRAEACDDVFCDEHCRTLWRAKSGINWN